MLSMLYIFTAVFVVVLALYLLFFPVRVCGDSMYPTLKDGEVYLTYRVSFLTEFEVGKIYVYKTPVENKYVIKRLKSINPQGKLFFEGDNKDYSYDSRHYGYIPRESVKFRVLTRKE